MAAIALPTNHTFEVEQASDPESFFADLYAELHAMAKRQLVRHSGQMTLSATTLLHQTYLDLAQRRGPSFPDSSRFMGYAARVMRGLIIDYARYRRVQKRGGLFEITVLDSDAVEKPVDDRELMLIGETLDELATIDPSLAELVDLKFFCGFSFAEIAAMQKLSERTVQRNWEKARLYLHRSIRPDLAV